MSIEYRHKIEETKGFTFEDRLIALYGCRTREKYASYKVAPDFVEKKTGKFVQVKGVNSSFDACGMKTLEEAVRQYLREEKSNYFMFDVSTTRGGTDFMHVLLTRDDIIGLIDDGLTAKFFRWVDGKKERVRPLFGPAKRVLLKVRGIKIRKG